LRYWVSYWPLQGARRTADIVFAQIKVDGCFWHGCQEQHTYNGVSCRPSRLGSLPLKANWGFDVGWSTRQLAELAGTTLRTIRHYHEVGLLAEPERRANGYKSYGVPHLVRVLRIKRLTELGLSLARIGELGDADEHPEEALKVLDAELASTIERLQRIRVELGLILREAAPTDLPPAVAKVVAEADLSPADRAFSVVLAQVLAPETFARYAESVREHGRHPVEVEFDALPEDADEETRQRIAEGMRELPILRELEERFPAGVYADAPRGAKYASEAAGRALVELYNAAQIDVLVRMSKKSRPR
jgi:DNA-binding transcriptional MerR regulator